MTRSLDGAPLTTVQVQAFRAAVAARVAWAENDENESPAQETLLLAARRRAENELFRLHSCARGTVRARELMDEIQSATLRRLDPPVSA